MEINLKLLDLCDIQGFQAASETSRIPVADLQPIRTLDVISGTPWRRSLPRTDLQVGSAIVSNCLYFGKYSGNGIANVLPGTPFRTYDGGGQFICSADGFFARDMIFAGSCIPDFVTKEADAEVYRLSSAADFESVDGDDYVFMGTYHSHFGHCLVESLTRLWYVTSLPESVRAHKKFVFFQGWGTEGGPIAEILPWLGVPKENIWVCNRNVLFKRLTVPSFAWRPWNAWDIYLSKEFFGPMRIISDIAAERSTNMDFAPKIYLTRRALDKSKLHHNHRELDSKKSELMERDLAKRGFRIIAPEQLDLIDQIALISRASHIVGPGGSAHHLAAFAYKAKVQIILTTEAFWMGGNDSVFAWDKPMHLAYVFGQPSDSSIPALVAPWDFELSDWEKAAATYSL